jgi:hypothetical protein
MEVYIIKNTKTNKPISGTNFRYFPVKQIFDKGILFFSTLESAEIEFERRKCSKSYKIIKAKVEYEKKSVKILFIT